MAASCRVGRSGGQYVAALVDQGVRCAQPPGLEGELRELVARDAVEVDHHPPEGAGRELDLEDVGSLGDQAELLRDGLLQPHRGGGRPEVAEGAAGDLEAAPPVGVVPADGGQLSDELEEVGDPGGHPRILPGGYPPTVDMGIKRLLNRGVLAGWRWLDRAGEITPGTRAADGFGSFGSGTSIGFPVATLMGTRSIHLG